MSTKETETETVDASAKKWYKSTTIQAVIAAIVVLVVLPRFGIEVPEDYSQDVYIGLASLVAVGLRKASTQISL